MTANSYARIVQRKPYVKEGEPIVDIGFGPDDEVIASYGTPTIDRTVSRKPYGKTNYNPESTAY